MNVPDPTMWDRAWFGVAAAAALLATRAVLSALLPKGYYFRVMDRWLARFDSDDDEDGAT